MEISFHINPEDINDRRTVLSLVRDALVGELFLMRKEKIDAQYQDGLITTGEYAQFLVCAATDAWTQTSNICDE